MQLGLKHQPSTQTFEPQLIPPASEPNHNSETLISKSKTSNKSDLTATITNIIDPSVQSKPVDKSSIIEPPNVPLPSSVSRLNNTALKNPYALRNNYNTLSNISHLSKSPSSTSGNSDSIPLYSASNVYNASNNLLSFLSGPQVIATTKSSEVLPLTTKIHSVDSTEGNSEIRRVSPESKPPLRTQDKQNSINEKNTSDSAPIIPFNTKICLPQTSYNKDPELKANNDIHSSVCGKIVPEAIPSVSHPAIYPSQPLKCKEHDLSDQAAISGIKSFQDIQTQSPLSRSDTATNMSLSSICVAQNEYTSLVNQELNIKQTLTALKSQPEIQDIVPELPKSMHAYTTQPVLEAISESELPKSVPLISTNNTNASFTSEFLNKSLPETLKNVESKLHHSQFSEIGTFTSGKCEVKESEGFILSSDITFTQSLSSTSKGSSLDYLGFQSKQVTVNNIPVSEADKAEISNTLSKDILTINSSVSPTAGNMQVPNPSSLSQFFKEPQATNNKNPLLDNAVGSVSDKPIAHSLFQPDTLSTSSYFQKSHSPSSSFDQNIQDSVESALTYTSPETIPQISAESSDRALDEASTVYPNSGATTNLDELSQHQNQPIITPDSALRATVVTNTTLANFSSPNSVKSNYSVTCDAPFLYPQPLYTFSKLNSDHLTSNYPAVDKPDPTTVNPLIPTFNYFSLPQSSCLPPSLDQPVQKSTTSSKNPSSCYYFKPIQKPDSITDLFLPHSSNPSNVEPPYQVLNPIPSTPHKTLTFPPPNVCYPKEIPSTSKQQTTQCEVAPILANTDNQNYIDSEELDQIPLEGSAVPLFNPETINKKNKVENPVAGNTFRLSGGIKKRTYAPVPDLGVTERKHCPPPTSPSGMSASSQEEMAAIHKNQNQNAIHTPTKTPESHLVVNSYLGRDQRTIYRPPYHHWFFKCGRDKKSPWTPFSMADSLNLEQVFTSSELHEDTKVSTDGGRYDVEVLRRKKMSIYWDETDGEVRRCSWFVKSISDSRYIPYDENIAALLEDEYKQGCETNEWNRKLELSDGEVIILHGPSAIAHHVRSGSPDAWSSQPPLPQKSRIVKRGVEDFDIPKGEPKQVDHLLLVVHGIGKACDLRFRSLVDVVDDFRSISLQLVQSHFHSGVENGMVGRCEVLPVEWHKALHTETIDDRLGAITLPSIPRAREFTNETLLDILFYTSPVFCEKIVQAVGAEINRVFAIYQKRNPGFRGQVSLGGHSLGSLILFDMLCHQQPVKKFSVASSRASFSEDDEDVDEVGCLVRKAKLNRRMSYLSIGPGTGQPYTIYPQLLFQPRAFFALGSPIGMFVTVRGVETLGEDFRFPTCPAFFNIFHPNDPVAYRIEALIKPEMANIPAVLIPHHKGRKRMHLELKETMAHVTAALKQKLVDSMKNTWNAVYQLAMFNRKDHTLQGEVNKVIEDEVLREASYLENDPPIGIIGEEDAGMEVRVGKLNDGRRIDYVLQEAPLETFNQYISAIRSHLVYWESEDTMLLMLKEIYGQMGITPDSQVPQPILPFDISGDSDTYSEYTYSIGAPPTQFVRK